MIDTQKNEFQTASSVEELREKVPEDARGAIFIEGEVIPIRGYRFQVRKILPHSLVLSPIGPIETRQAKRLRKRIAR